MRSLALACVAFMAACSDSEDKPTRMIQIGALVPLTEGSPTPGTLELAVSHVNAGLSAAGHGSLQFELLTSNDGSDTTPTLGYAQDLVGQGAKALVTYYSANSILLNRTAYDDDPSNDLNVPLLCGAGTTNDINNPNVVKSDAVDQAALRNDQKWHFRMNMKNSDISPVLVRIALGLATNDDGDVNGDGQFKLAIYATNNNANLSLDSELRAAATSLSTLTPVFETVKHPATLDVATYDWGSDMTMLSNNINESASNVADGYPDVIIFAIQGSYTAAVSQAYITAGVSIPSLHSHAFRNINVLSTLGGQADGLEGASQITFDPSESGEAFNDSFQDSVGTPPFRNDAVLYDAAVAAMLGALIPSIGMDDPTLVTGAEVRDGIMQISSTGGEVVRVGNSEMAKAVRAIAAGNPINYEGASGPVDFDTNNNARIRLVHFVVQGGAFVDLESYDCVTDPTCPLIP